MTKQLHVHYSDNPKITITAFVQNGQFFFVLFLNTNWKMDQIRTYHNPSKISPMTSMHYLHISESCIILEKLFLGVRD